MRIQAKGKGIPSGERAPLEALPPSSIPASPGRLEASPLSDMSGAIRRNLTPAHLAMALNQSWRLISGFLTLLLIPAFLDPVLQGYWFTLTALGALVVLADLGFSTIVLQFAAHEAAHLRFRRDGFLAGSPRHMDRLASFLRYSLRWAGRMSLFASPVIFLVGILVLGSRPGQVEWLFPWILYTAGAVLQFIVTSAISFFEGCNKIPSTQGIRLAISLATFITLATLLWEGKGLMALPLGLLAGGSTGAFLVGWVFRRPLLQLIRRRPAAVSWQESFRPLFARYAVSWASSYFLYQAFTPIAFTLFGSVVAGQVGMSGMVVNALFNFAYIWLYVRIPTLNMLVSRGERAALDHVFRRDVTKVVLSYLLLVGVFLAALPLVQERFDLSSRLLPLGGFLILAACWFLHIFISGWTIYVRAHKQEPFVPATLAAAILIPLATWVCALRLPSTWFFLGFLGAYLAVLPLFYLPFKRLRAEGRSLPVSVHA